MRVNCWIAGWTLSVLLPLMGAAAEDAKPWQLVSGEWSFLHGAWTGGIDGQLVPPRGGGKEYVALRHSLEYSDLDARVRFRFHSSHGGARLLFRVRDSLRYYALDIPWAGQQNRARHMWAGLLVADGQPLARYLTLVRLPGVVPRHGHWFEGRVEAKGSRLRAWVEGRLVADVDDRAHDRGRVGLLSAITAGSVGPDFADLRVSGRSHRAPPIELTAPARHWITPLSQTDPDAFQSYPNLLRAKTGTLAVSIPFGNPGTGEARRTVSVRSADAGRTWSAPEPSTLPKGFQWSFVRQDGTWVALASHLETAPSGGLDAVESRDEGRTWTPPRKLPLRASWPQHFTVPAYFSGQPLRLRDGALLVPVYTGTRGNSLEPPVTTNAVFRSTDDGETWDDLVRTDLNNPQPGSAGKPDARWFVPGDFSEIGLAEAAGDVVVGLGRPYRDPTFWQVRSVDGGKSWEPAGLSDVPGYCISLTRTASGALVAIRRFPYLSATVSWDGGVTWDAGTFLDYPIWSNHKAVEVEPDVVLVVYMGHMVDRREPGTRILRLRVTRKGLSLAP